MSRLDRLLRSYQNFISVPWREDAAPGQRVVFCVYPQNYELQLRANIEEFELATQEAGHPWARFDLTNTFANWLSEQRYASCYFKEPKLIATLLPNYLTFIRDRFFEFLEQRDVDQKTVVALTGVGSLYGFLRVRELVDEIASAVPGRLIVFFPGSYENNNYRLLDGYDGWNYLAVPITAERDH